MGKRKAKSETLTKIDPSTLKLKPLAVSQHATGNRRRVTTTLKPIRPPLATPLPDPGIFNAEPSNFTEQDLDHGDEGGLGDEEAILREYFTGPVRSFFFPQICRGSFQC